MWGGNMKKTCKMKIFKYSQENLFKFVGLLRNRIYLIFYDLEDINFHAATNILSNYIKIIKTKVGKNGRTNCLIVFAVLDTSKLEALLSLLDSMDIGEFEIGEYQNKQEKIDIDLLHSIAGEVSAKKIYVNKDERGIQLYNFNN